MCVHSHIYSQEGHCDLFYPSNVLIFRFLPLANLTMTTRWQSLYFFFIAVSTIMFEVVYGQALDFKRNFSYSQFS